MVECQQGYKEIEGKCVKTQNQEVVKTSEWLGANQIKGLLLIGVAFIILKFVKPVQQECSWWNIFCHIGHIGTSPIYGAGQIITIVAASILVLAGVLYLIDINLKTIIGWFT